MPIPQYVSVKEASTVLGISEQRVRTLLRSKKLEGDQIGKTWVVQPTSLKNYTKEFQSKTFQDKKRKVGKLPKIKALSFFSGAMGLDLGLEQAGIHMLMACEIDKACRQTIKENRPDLALLGDIWNYSAVEIKNAAGLKEDDEIDVVVGGPPCQAFSTAGARRGFKDDRGNALLKYVDLILELRPRYAVLENVRGLLSAPLSHRPHIERNSSVGEELKIDELPGGALMHVLKLLKKGGYGISFNLYNSANFGVPQVRERVIIICHREGDKVPHLLPTHSDNERFSLPKWKTLRDAFKGLDNKAAEHVNFPPDRLRYYKMLKAGQYWKHLPEKLQKEALGKSFFSGGGKTGFLRRLSWDKPSCTLVTYPAMPATDICHPVEDRPLSVAEYKRIQQFPDDWKICGSIKEQYKQIGNAVPVGLGFAVGVAIKSHMSGQKILPPVGFPFSRYKENDEISWENKITSILKISGKKKSKPDKQIDKFKLKNAA